MFTLTAFDEDTLASDITDAATSATLTTGAFGTPTGEQMLVIDYNVAAKREIIKCAIDGTAVTSIDRAQDGTAAVAHSSGAKVIMAFVPSHYKALTDFVGARAYLASTLGTTATTTWTKVALNTESYDVGANFASNKFTAPVNGYYLVSGTVRYAACTDDQSYYTGIYKNGALYTHAVTSKGSAAEAAASTGPCCTDIIYLDATDYVELYYYHTGATTVDVVGSEAGTYLSVHLLKETN